MSQFFLGSVWGRAHMGSDTGAAEARADRASRSAEAVETRLERALLTMEAMWSLLRDRLGASDDELVGRLGGGVVRLGIVVELTGADRADALESVGQRPERAQHRVDSVHRRSA